MGYDARIFSEQSYNENDKEAKDIFIEYLINKGYTIINSEENFEHDLLAKDKLGNEIFFELEFKTGVPFTSRKTFKYDTVSFTGRKKRLHDIKPFIYVIICKETYWALSIPSNEIYWFYYEEFLTINSRDRKGSDKFFRVPKDKCKFFNLKKNLEN